MGMFHFSVFLKEAKNIFKKDELCLEIAGIAIPSALALTADPIASLIDTAFIGHIGPVELAAVGISIAVFNQASKIVIIPLVSITTSFVAEDEANEKMIANIEMEELESLVESSSTKTKQTEMLKLKHVKKRIPSASSAMFIASVLGLVQALFLIMAAKPVLKYMGVDSNSPMLKPAMKYLTLRSLGAPAVLLSLAIQGIFRGLKDTKTPLYATLIGDLANIILDPILIFILRLGVSGAAIAHIISQYLLSLILMWRLMKQVDLLPPSLKDLQVDRFLKSGLLVLVKVIAATLCVTYATSLAAKQGPSTMAAFQVCLQIWLATSLLADSLAVAGQAILANAFAKNDHAKVIATTSRVLQFGLVLGLFLSIVIPVVLKLSLGLFTTDANVLNLIITGIPFVALTQPINALAFVCDGVNYGASDFAYSAYSMVLVAVITIWCQFELASSKGFVGIWIALSLFMCLRTFVGFSRVVTGTGPWSFLKG